MAGPKGRSEGKIIFIQCHALGPPIENRRDDILGLLLLRSQADALLACDFFETVTLGGARLYVMAVIEHDAMGLTGGD